MERILITGSLGYFGSMLTNYLSNKGYLCKGIDTGFFKDELLYSSEEGEIVIKDVRDMTESDLKDIDVVIHLAGISNDPVGSLDAASVYDPTRTYTLAIAKICKKLQIRLIFASSCSVYGVGGDDFLTENSKTNPQTYYSLNKIQIEEDLISLSDKHFSPIALRFATIFGLSPRVRFDVVINMFVGMALSSGNIILNSDGKAWRPNLYILDACEAVRCAIDLNYGGQELLVLNVGADTNNMQVIEIAENVKQSISGCQIKFLNNNPELGDGLIADRKINKGNDTRTYKVSFEKIQQVMSNFKVRWNIESGVKDMVEELNKLSFDSTIFKHRGFYRLQHLEDLYERKELSDDLRWVDKESILA